MVPSGKVGILPDRYVKEKKKERKRKEKTKYIVPQHFTKILKNMKMVEKNLILVTILNPAEFAVFFGESLKKNMQ